MTRVADLAELIRAPAVLTVIGDTMAGSVAARGTLDLGAVPLAAASACLYAAGMALNDYADADLDAIERPERPLPSGRVTRGSALAVAGALTTAGVGLACIASRGAGVVSLGIASAVWFYDLRAKTHPAGVVVMGACRGLDVFMGGVGAGWRGALLPTAAMFAHTAVVTAISRGEVTGTTRMTAGAGAVTSVAVAAVGAVSGARRRATPAALLAAAGYLGAGLPGQLASLRNPSAANARSATREGIGAMVPAQAIHVAGGGSAVGTAVLGLLWVSGRVLAAHRLARSIT